MKSFGQRKLGAAVALIFSLIAFGILSIVYLRVHKETKELGSFMQFITSDPMVFGLFVGFSVFWFILYLISNVKYSHVKRDFGGYFGCFLGRLFLLAELGGYVAFMVFLFI